MQKYIPGYYILIINSYRLMRLIKNQDYSHTKYSYYNKLLCKNMLSAYNYILSMDHNSLLSSVWHTLCNFLVFFHMMCLSHDVYYAAYDKLTSTIILY